VEFKTVGTFSYLLSLLSLSPDAAALCPRRAAARALPTPRRRPRRRRGVPLHRRRALPQRPRCDSARALLPLRAGAAEGRCAHRRPPPSVPAVLVRRPAIPPPSSSRRI
jgi:hypothetical protein